MRIVIDILLVLSAANTIYYGKRDFPETSYFYLYRRGKDKSKKCKKCLPASSHLYIFYIRKHKRKNATTIFMKIKFG